MLTTVQILSVILAINLVSSATLPEISGVTSSFTVQTAPTGCSSYISGQQSALNAKGFTKFVCPFGIMICGVASMPDSELLFAANVLATLLDRNADGVADSQVLLDALVGQQVVAGGGSSQATEDVDVSSLGIKYMFGLQAWKSDEQESHAKRIIFEEIFHMVTQYGYGIAWPSVFGVTDFTSTICAQMAALECVKPGWWHEENTCPNGERTTGNASPPPLQGTCNTANCDCVEFYHQAVTISVGQTPGWYSPYMPTTASAMNAIFNQAFKDALANSLYVQMQSPISGLSYGATPTSTGAGTTTTTTAGSLSTVSILSIMLFVIAMFVM